MPLFSRWSSVALRAKIGCYVMLCALAGSPGRAQQAGGVAASGPEVRMVRVVVGAKGEPRNGTYLMTDRRTTFYVPDDREVVVYFEWEGPLGTHHCEASVRGPSGEFSSMSSFNYTATQPRFGGYWKVPLSEDTPAGNWIVEAKVDGEAAGQATFRIVPGATPANAPKAAPVPSVAELYKLVLASTVQIEKLDASGKVLRRQSGFLARQGEIFTSFRGIDGATTLRVLARVLQADGLTVLPNSPNMHWQSGKPDASPAKICTARRIPHGRFAAD